MEVNSLFLYHILIPPLPANTSTTFHEPFRGNVVTFLYLFFLLVPFSSENQWVSKIFLVFLLAATGDAPGAGSSSS